MVVKREFPRFKVVDLQELTGVLEGVKLPIRLATFGLGGCGFYATGKSPLLNPPKRVFCVFSYNNCEPIKVQGNLIYSREIPSPETNVVFFGVEFISPHRPMVEPIVRALEELKNEGRVIEA